MRPGLLDFIVRLTAARPDPPQPEPMILELMERREGGSPPDYVVPPFFYRLTKAGGVWGYGAGCDLTDGELSSLRLAVSHIAATLDPRSVVPLTFERLTEVLTQAAAARLGREYTGALNAELSELAAYEAMGLSRILCLAKDEGVTEFYVDSDSSPVYLDHARAGRCWTAMMLTQREREAIATHMDTFRGYSLDYASPSMKNDIQVGGAKLRVSLDLEPTSVNRFSMDVRRLSLAAFDLEELVEKGVLSGEGAAFLSVWLEDGGNVTIVGEPGTGKTTLMNALDERVDPRLRRVYIEDAVETKDLLSKGYHQLKIKVDPFDRGGEGARSKASEIVKALHRSPDLVILSEIQSEEHSRAFFHALSAGIRGMQTFHSSSLEQAMRRWTVAEGIQQEALLNLGVMVQMSRPKRLGPERIVARIAVVVPDSGLPRLREVYSRGRDGLLARVTDWSRIPLPPGSTPESFERDVVRAGGLAKADES